MSRKAILRLLLLVILGGVFAFVGFTILQGRDPRPFYAAAQKHHEAGLGKEKAGDFPDAAREYSLACVQLGHALDRLNGAHGLDEKIAKEVAGKVLFLKSKALRDKHYAQAAATGVHLPLTTDSVTGEEFRNILAIRDAADRDEAAANLRGAATLFALGDLDVQREGLRLALMSSPIEWSQVERHSKAVLSLAPDDSRAKYLLAKIEFEQPDLATSLPTPPKKRSRERIRAAGRLINEVRADPAFPLWRTEHLRAGVHHWLAKHSPGARDKRTEANLHALDQLLFDSSQGALTRIRQRRNMEHLGLWDSEGILGIYAVAAEVALSKTRRDPADPKAETEKVDELALVQKVFREAVAFCAEKLGRRDPVFQPASISATLLTIMVDGQTVLPVQDQTTWQQGLSLLKTSMKRELQSGQCIPERVAQLAELLMRESLLAERRTGASGRSDELRSEAKLWLAEGFAFGARQQLADAQLMPLHLIAANIGFLAGDSRAEVKPHLDFLQRSKLPTAVAASLLIDGGYDEREGRLVKAQAKIERAVAIEGGEEEIRGHAMLLSIYMALDRPDYALINLTYLRKTLDHLDDLTNLERVWWADFIGTPLDLDAISVVVHLENARRSIADHRSKNPDSPAYSAAIVKADEDAVKALLVPLGSSGPGFAARAAWVHHLTAAGRLKEAEEQWKELKAASPGRIEVLTLKVGLMERTAAESGDDRKMKSLAADVESHILAFVKAHPANHSARVYHAIWLMQNGRADRAIAELKTLEPTLPSGLRRAVLSILLTEQSGRSPLLRHLPRGPQVDQTWLDLNRHASVQSGGDVLAHFETSGLARILHADDLYLAGSYTDAAELFAATLDFAPVKSVAQRGLLRSVFALADQDPAAAETAVDRIIDEFPEEPAARLALAYVRLAQGRIGSPADDWNLQRTLGAALNAWEHKLTRLDRGTSSRVPMLLTKSAFWLRANHGEIALDQAKLALSQDPRNPETPAACLEAVLGDRSRDPRPRVTEYLEALQKVGDSAAGRCLMGRAAEALGKRDDAIRVFEEAVEKYPDHLETYAYLVDSVADRGDAERALRWIKTWRDKSPGDLPAAAAEVRVLSQSKKVPAAIAVADEFLKQSQALGVQRAEAATHAAARSKIVEDARWLPEIELARGFSLGGVPDEAERRLMQLPRPYADRISVQELRAEIALQKKQWKNAEAILEAIVQKNPRHFAALSDLATVLTIHGKNPARARTVVLAAIAPDSPTDVPADRLPAPLLHAIGAVYTALADPKYGQELRDFFAAATDRFPNDPRMDLYSGYGCELIGEHARAYDHYERAIKKSNQPGVSAEERLAVLTDAAAFRERVGRKLSSPKK